MSELVKGKTIFQALRLTDGDIIEYLDGLPEQKQHCSLLCLHALHAAVADYNGKRHDE